MWILVLILSTKLKMPTWYWIIFTAITILRPFAGILKHEFYKNYIEARK